MTGDQAGFLGNPPMNLFEGSFQGQTWHGKEFSLEAHPYALGEGREVLLGIRPEHIAIVSEGFPAIVETIERHYSERLQVLHLRIGETLFAASVASDLPIRPGETMPVRFPVENLFFFDPASGKRLGVKAASA